MQTKLLSQTITNLRFPMIVGIVFIHAAVESYVNVWGGQETMSDFTAYKFIMDFFSRGVSSACVPLFFLISGFLFYQGNTFSLKVYGNKLRKRVHSLLIPYLIYNATALLIFALFQELMPQMVSEGKMAVADYSLNDLAMAFWKDQGSNIPIDGPLWFIRNLMVVVVLSPIIYVYVRYLKIIGVVVLGCLWFSGIGTYDIPGSTAVFFFSIGAYFALNKIDFGDLFCDKLFYLIWIYPIILVVDSLTKGSDYTLYIHNVDILIGVVSWTIVAYHFQRRINRQIPEVLTAATFFIYAFHEPYMDQVNKVIARVLPLSDNIVIFQLQGIILYFVVTSLYIAALVVGYKIICRISPTLASLLSGGR